MYKPDHFELHELLPKDFYRENMTKSFKLLWMFDQRALWTLDQLRNRYGSLIVNDWWWHGSNQYRGWRPFDSQTGSTLSQHKFGRAFDCILKDVPSEQVRQDIKADPWRDEFKFITGIEDGVSWLHFDVRNWGKERRGLFIFRQT